MTLEQINLMLTHLPVDMTFVDENDRVVYYSEGPERIFPRSPAIIGREVRNCHPPNSVHMVTKILEPSNQAPGTRRLSGSNWVANLSISATSRSEMPKGTTGDASTSART